MYTIYKNIPLPEPKTREPNRLPTRAGTEFSKTIRALEVGDCFDAPNKKIKDVHASFSYYKRKFGWEFTARTMSDGCVRIWRKK